MWKPPIAEVLRYYYPQVRLSFGGGWETGWQKILCPVHCESNASATVCISENRWKCFVCNLSEDSYDFIMREEGGIAFKEARKIAVERFGGGSEVLLQSVQRQPGGEVRSRPRFGGTGSQSGSGIRRFGSNR